MEADLALPRLEDLACTLCALEDCCRHPTARRVRVCEVQLITPDTKRTFRVLAVPVGKCRTLDLKRETLVRLVDDVSAEMSEASRNNSDALVCRRAGAAIRRKLREATRNEDD